MKKAFFAPAIIVSAVAGILMFTGFGFDVFFTIEFLSRFYHSFINRRASSIRGRGTTLT